MAAFGWVNLKAKTKNNGKKMGGYQKGIGKMEKSKD